MEYPLVNVCLQFANFKKMAQSKCRNVVDLPIDSMVNLSSSFFVNVSQAGWHGNEWRTGILDIGCAELI
jgi:hypothetical protein